MDGKVAIRFCYRGRPLWSLSPVIRAEYNDEFIEWGTIINIDEIVVILNVFASCGMKKLTVCWLMQKRMYG